MRNGADIRPQSVGGQMKAGFFRAFEPFWRIEYFTVQAGKDVFVGLDITE
jgi:hypothetical protein